MPFSSRFLKRRLLSYPLPFNARRPAAERACDTMPQERFHMRNMTESPFHQTIIKTLNCLYCDHCCNRTLIDSRSCHCAAFLPYIIFCAMTSMIVVKSFRIGPLVNKIIRKKKNSMISTCFLNRPYLFLWIKEGILFQYIRYFAWNHLKLILWQNNRTSSLFHPYLSCRVILRLASNGLMQNI